MKLIVTIDVEEDASADWSSAPVGSFRGIGHGIGQVLQPLFRDLGVRPTLLISPVVLQDAASVDILRRLENVELGAHLHWEQIAPDPERAIRNGRHLLRHMQWDFPPELEFAKLKNLTELFRRQFGYAPTSFRAGRYGASRSTGGFLKQLGYEVDSSATPHVRWMTPAGGCVDYTRAPEQPYYIGAPGDIYQQGDFGLLEVPITILPQNAMPGMNHTPWFRPGNVDAASLKEIVRIVRERNCAGVEQPLVMMFHNVEVVAGASPYTQSEEDVRGYLDAMRGALDYALKSGFETCALTDYARAFKQESARAAQTAQAYRASLAEGAAVDNGIGIPFAEVRRVIDRHGNVSAWHHYIYKDRDKRWDVRAISEWVASNLPKNAALLSAGCGMGFNLYWWARQGFINLSGFDQNENTIAASQELAERFGFPLRLWHGRAEDDSHAFREHFDYIEAMNCLMYAEGTYRAFLKAYVPALKSGGYLAFDAIDASYNAMPNNQWHTATLARPEAERSPSEYKVRLSETEVAGLAAEFGLAPAAIIKNPGEIIPRIIYIFRKSAAPDTPNLTIL